MKLNNSIDVTEVPRDWSLVTILDVCDILSGGTPRKSEAGLWRGSIPWVSGKDLKVPRLRDTIDHVADEALGSGTRLAPAGAVFVLVRGMGLAKDLPVALALRPMAFNQDIKALVPKRPGTGAFIRAAIYHSRARLLSKIVPSAHGTMTLNLDDIETLSIPMPNDDEDAKRIGLVLDIAMNKAEQAEHELRAVQNLKRAAMRALFARGLRGETQKDTEIGPVPESWETPTVAESVRPFRSDRGKQIAKSAYRDTGRWPIIDQGQQAIAGYTDDPEKIITSNEPLIIFGDHTRIFKFVDFPFSLGADGTKPLLSREGFVPKFLFHALNGLDVPARGYNRHYTVLSEMRLPKPTSLDEQREIVAVLDAIDRKLGLHRRKRAVLDELFKALLHKLMTGEILVADLDLSALDVKSVTEEAA